MEATKEFYSEEIRRSGQKKPVYHNLRLVCQPKGGKWDGQRCEGTELPIFCFSLETNQ